MRKIKLNRDKLKILTHIQKQVEIGEKQIQETDRNLAEMEKKLLQKEMPNQQ
ncbi:MAG: hypothetical protein HC820_03560 [Hydrococcus sp. RM1_1_31]|nr:hypothetical protein [Hydrococcus sp. RM1_1_31]